MDTSQKAHYTHPNLPAVGVVGGRGRMGTWFVRFFTQAGLPVLVSDLNTELTPEDLARQCQVVVLSLPMEVFPEVVRKVGPLMGRDSLLTDLCSLKERQVACMLEHSSCDVVGTHPLFGPGEDSLSGRRVALCAGRGRRWLTWWEGLLKKHGAVIHCVSPSEHDRTMAWVQALNHFVLLSLGKALEEDGIDLHQLLALATPSFEMQMDIVARLWFQDPDLYATIQMENSFTGEALSAFTRNGAALRDIVMAGDRLAFVKLFKDVQELGRMVLEAKNTDVWEGT